MPVHRHALLGGFPRTDRLAMRFAFRHLVRVAPTPTGPHFDLKVPQNLLSGPPLVPGRWASDAGGTPTIPRAARAITRTARPRCIGLRWRCEPPCPSQRVVCGCGHRNRSMFLSLVASPDESPNRPTILRRAGPRNPRAAPRIVFGKLLRGAGACPARKDDRRQPRARLAQASASPWQNRCRRVADKLPRARPWQASGNPGRDACFAADHGPYGEKL